MALDIEKAKAAGYSDSELVDYLAKDSTLDVVKARKVGYSDTELLKHLSASSTTSAPVTPAATPIVPLVPAVAPDRAPEEKSLREGDPLFQRMFGKTVGTPLDTVLGGVADMPLQAAASGAGGFKTIVDFFGANSSAGKALANTQDYLMGLTSAQAKNDSEEMARIFKEAEDKGFGEQLKAAAKAISIAPLDALAMGVGSMAPILAATAATVLTGGGVLAGVASTLGLGAIMGAGTVKGTIYDATKVILKEKTNLSDKEIEKVAQQAQSYDGENLDNILIGAGLGAVAARTGAEAIIARSIAKRVGTEATKKVVDEQLKKAAVEAGKAGVKKNAAMKAGEEFVTETLQGGQEQLSKNLAEKRLGFDTPTMRGVVSQGVYEGLAGALVGGIAGGREAYKAPYLTADRMIPNEEEKNFLAPKDAVRSEPKQQNLTEEQIALFNPAVDAGTGTTLATIDAAPATVDDKTTNAQKYMDEVDATGKKNQSKLKKIISDLGIDVEVGKGFNDRAITAIKAKLAEGALDATGTEQQSAGAGSAVDTKPVVRPPARRTTKPESGRVVSTDTTTTQPIGGETPQSTALAELKAKRAELTDQRLKLFGGSDKKPSPNSKKGIALAALNAKAMELDNEIQKAEAGLGGLQTAATAEPKNEWQQLVSKFESQGMAPSTATSEARTALYERIDEIENFIVTEGLPLTHPKVLNKISTLNKLEEQAGVEKSVFNKDGLSSSGDVLSAKGAEKPKSIRQLLQEFMKTGVADPRLVAVQQDTTPAFQIDPNATADENLKGAMELGKLYEDQEKAASKAAYDESLGKSELKYNAQQELKQTDAEAFYGMQPRIGGAISEENRANYEKMREEFPGLPAWDKLNVDDKDVYFGDMRYGNLPEHRKAAQALLDYQAELGSREAGYNKKKDITGPPTRAGQAAIEAAEKTATPSGRRIILNYEANRREASKLYGVKFPRWGDLSPLVKKAYAQEIVNNAGKQQDRAFAKAAEQIVAEREGATSGQTQKEIQNIRERQAKVRKDAEEEAKKLAKIQKDYARITGLDNKTNKSGLALSNKVMEHLTNGRLNAALNEIAESLKGNPDPRKKMISYVARLLTNLNIKSTIEIKPFLSDADLGQYDPKSDTISLSQAGGLTIPTLLHEVSHAATVRVLHMFSSNGQVGRDGKPLPNLRNQLSAQQIAGAEQIYAIMRQSGVELADEYPNAYTDVYEFVAYAMNDSFFQADLAALGFDYGDIVKFQDATGISFGAEDIPSILPRARSMWSEFKKSVAKLFGTPKGAIQSNNFMLQISAAFEDILSVPTGGITNLGKLSAKQAEDIENTVDTASGIEGAENHPRYKLSPKELPKHAKKLYETLTTSAGWRKIATYVQNRRYHAKNAQTDAELAGRLIRDLSLNFNNYYSQAIVSAAEAENFYISRLQLPMEQLRSSIQDFAKTMKLSAEDAIARLHAIVELFHEPERRFVKWLLTVPLSTAKTLTHNGKLISPAERRVQIVGDKSKGIPGIINMVELTDAQKVAFRQELEMLTGGRLTREADGTFSFSKNGGYVDLKAGETLKTDSKIASEDFYAVDYNVLGIGKPDIDKRRAELAKFTPEVRATVDKILESVSQLTKESAELDKIGNFWSYHVSNLVGIYGFNYYLPFKGKGKGKEGTKQDSIDEMIDLDSKGNGRDMQEAPVSMNGRFSSSANPLLQVMSDATRAASRAGMRNLTQAVKNALPKSEKNPNGTNILEGKVELTVLFKDREIANIQQYKTDKYIWNHNSDGSIDILYVADPYVRNSIRHTFQDANVLLDLSNRITGMIGRMHTRYNYDFPLVNFARDLLTNAWTIGAKYGPLKSLQLIKEISTQVATQNGLYKAMMVAALHDKPDAVSRQQLMKLAEKDPYVQTMLEYISEGGKTTYLSGFSLKSQIEELDSGMGKGRIATTIEQGGKILDVWNNMFEFASRTAAYGLLRDQFFRENTKKHPDWSRERSMNEAMSRAKTDTKELANFESVGEYGRALGAIYMFIRASATGAVAAVEATAPAFRDIPLLSKFTGTREGLINSLPEGIRDDPEAVKTYLENYKKLQTNARMMITALMSSGMLMFVLSAASADDDDMGRNATMNDNMQQWSRYARFHIPSKVSNALGLGDNVVFQIPWGFGLGAFAAAGAQIVAMGMGVQSVKDGMGNMVSSMLDSYVPIPISKISPTENPLQFGIDSVAPSVLRPLVEFAMNMNGIGQEINSASTRRMADAFTGGDRIPELYRSAAQYILEATDGEWDISPNSLFFLANSYADGLSRVVQLQYNSQIGDEREFSPKEDLPLLGSFFGAKSNVDSREFGKMEKKIKEISQKLSDNTARAAPEIAARYEANHPLYRTIVDIYNDKKGEMDALHKEANEIRVMPIKVSERQALLKINILFQNILKREMVEQFKAYDLEP